MPGSSPYLFPEEYSRTLLERECNRALRYQQFFSILVIRLNIAGFYDPSLSSGIQLILEEIRGSDTIAALEGNKVVIILPYAENTPNVASRIINKIQGRLPQLQIMGGACYPTDATSVEGLLQVAQSRERSEG